MDEEEEVVIVVRRVVKETTPVDPNTPLPSETITRIFSGCDRFKKAKKFLTALQD